MNQSVTVDGSGINLNTTDASVSTVVDQRFVENIPLNGRSFQSLMTLAPGVLIAPSHEVGGRGDCTFMVLYLELAWGRLDLDP